MDTPITSDINLQNGTITLEGCRLTNLTTFPPYNQTVTANGTITGKPTNVEISGPTGNNTYWATASGLPFSTDYPGIRGRLTLIFSFGVDRRTGRPTPGDSYVSVDLDSISRRGLPMGAAPWYGSCSGIQARLPLRLRGESTTIRPVAVTARVVNGRTDIKTAPGSITSSLLGVPDVVRFAAVNGNYAISFIPKRRGGYDGAIVVPYIYQGLRRGRNSENNQINTDYWIYETVEFEFRENRNPMPRPGAGNPGWDDYRSSVMHAGHHHHEQWSPCAGGRDGHRCGSGAHWDHQHRPQPTPTPLGAPYFPPRALEDTDLRRVAIETNGGSTIDGARPPSRWDGRWTSARVNLRLNYRESNRLYEQTLDAGRE